MLALAERVCWGMLTSAAAVLAIAARHVESEGVQGSCTACILTINKESGKLQSATLGDSGFLIIGQGPASSVDAEGEVRHGQVEHVCTFLVQWSLNMLFVGMGWCGNR